MQRALAAGAIAAIAIAGAAAAGCSSGGSGNNKTATSQPPANATAANAETVVARGTITLPTPDPQLALKPFDSKVDPYTISVPDGWVQEAARFGGDIFYAGDPNSFAPQLKVTCLAGNAGSAPTAEGMLDEDRTGLANSSIGVTAFAVTDIQAGGLAGKRAVYTVNTGNLHVRNLVAYFGGKGCGWRIRLNVFTRPDDNPDPKVYDGLFDRIVATFAPHDGAAGGAQG